MHYLEQPIFITGFNKSGTTLLLSLLDSHPQLLVFPEELDFFKEVLCERDKSKAIKERTGFRMFLTHRKTEKWSPGVDWLKEGYPEFDYMKFDQLAEQILQTYESSKDLLLNMVKAFAEADNIETVYKTHWVSKSTQDEMFFPVMSKMFNTGCKLVYVVRDPRDVYLSLSKRRVIAGRQSIRSIRGLITFCVCWQTQINQALHYLEKHPNVWILHYEDLLFQTKNTLDKLCNFLQIRFSDELLCPTRHGKRWGGNSVFSDHFEELSKEPVGRYKQNLYTQEILLIEKFLSKELVLLGYDEYASKYPVKGEYLKAHWLDYRITALKYLRWYFYKKYSSIVRYSISQLH